MTEETNTITGVVNAHGKPDNDGTVRSFAIKGHDGFLRLSKFPPKNGGPLRLPAVGAEVDCDVNEKGFATTVRIMSPDRQASEAGPSREALTDRETRITRLACTRDAVAFITAAMGNDNFTKGLDNAVELARRLAARFERWAEHGYGKTAPTQTGHDNPPPDEEYE